MTHLLPRIGTPVAVVLSGLLLSSCAMFRPEEEEDAKKKDRFEFLRSERQPREAAKPESIEEEQVLPKPAGRGAREEEARGAELQRREARASGGAEGGGCAAFLR